MIPLQAVLPHHFIVVLIGISVLGTSLSMTGNPLMPLIVNKVSEEYTDLD